MIQDEYFKKWLDDKFKHLEDKIDKMHLEKKTKSDDIDERILKIEEHQLKDDGMWKAYGKLATIGGGIVGGIIGWVTNKFF